MLKDFREPKLWSPNNTTEGKSIAMTYLPHVIALKIAGDLIALVGSFAALSSVIVLADTNSYDIGQGCA